MKKQYISLILISVLILIIISSFIIYNKWPLMTGKKLVLATLPVDPFDPFRGQYMAINYDISRISEVEGFKAGDYVYVVLKKDGEGIWRKESVSRSKPDSGDFIKGKVISADVNSARVEYGIEQFFFERNAKLPTTNITVEVSVASSGRAKISQMLFNSEPLKIEYEKFDVKS